MKNVVVVKRGPGCKVLINPNPENLKGQVYLTNPDITAVRGLPPEVWKIVDGVLEAERPGLLPPVDPRSYEAVQRDFVTLRRDVNKGLRNMKRLSTATAVAMLLLIASLVYLARTYINVHDSGPLNALLRQIHSI